ncbi:hypothetical protein CANMA_002030 [Candida margitis]|uniref:uncharacterized protein n=1 Tax=Candida margitis TaxID=1775924 RepID=UPI002226B449|nr:uncharacterized protein CANMA_002030 [Candida margitis]KAI5968856.1 hypothetical protein CANMA_002030 [Candida margitis]
MLTVSAGENPRPDFEESLRVVKIDDTHYVGAHCLRKPVKMARGIYGGHMIAQSLLVGIESTRLETTNEVMIPDSYHSFFINAGNNKTPMEYEVTKLYDDELISKRSIVVSQGGKNRLTCVVILRKQGTKPLHKIDENIPPPLIQTRYPDPDKLHQVQHTDFCRNAFDDDFVDHRRTPEERKLHFAERWISIFTGLKNIPEPGAKYDKVKDALPDAVGNMQSYELDILRPKNSQSVKDPIYNYVGLGEISDSTFITTLARVLHIPWAPSLERGEEYVPELDATYLMRSSLNALHVLHYNAMSLDHHIYFHNDEYEPTDGSAFDISKDWLAFTYQMKRLSNGRVLARGYMFNENRKCVATVLQEGLALLSEGVATTADKSRL